MSKIAIIGMSARIPGADSLAEFWSNLRNGVESISHFSPEELEVEGNREQTKDPSYVRARSVLRQIDRFDAGLFGIYPQDAKTMDPQHRVFLECCWEAFEDAGYDPATDPAVTGVFAGCSPNSYFLRQICQSTDYIRQYTEAYQVGFYPTMLGTIGDTLATRVSYKLNLKGPSLTMLSACSTSLVAISQAVKSLLFFECDLALAGGVSITLPQNRGYLYEPGGMTSPDGHCRSFDAAAQGTVFGSGAGVVLLKRLEEAEADGDPIYAVIRGSAVNNDGAGKAGFTAPSVEGQARVIALAQAVAEVEPSSITYVEAHGTATPLGDPIEVAALTQVFRAATDEKQFCALGSVKANVGHLDAAAGVIGLIKTALSLQHRELPPLLHFRSPNPKLNLPESPFYINTERRAWQPKDGLPLRAGVSAFGVGGTNAHVVLEEAPAPAPREPGQRRSYLLPVSARSPQAVKAACHRLAAHLGQHPELDPADVARTLELGRHHFAFRQFAVGQTAAELAQALTASGEKSVPSAAAAKRPVAFLFPGQGVQRVNMGRDLYETEPVFRQNVDLCSALLQPHLKLSLREVLYPGASEAAAAESRLADTVLSQPAIFTVCYSLAQLWMHWGVRPAAMTGHSIGEFVAACLAGVMALPDSLAIIAKRGELMQALPRGSMLSVRLGQAEILPELGHDLWLAAVNSPSLVVVSGTSQAISALESRLEARGVAAKKLLTSHAFHSGLMEPITDEFTRFIEQFELRAPQIPYVSTVTGDWITAADAVRPAYWARHFRQPVQFARAVEVLQANPELALLEVGPGSTLQSLTRQNGAALAHKPLVLSSLAPAADGVYAEAQALQKALGTLWAAGAGIVWKNYAEAGGKRVSLPAYPFERERYWIDSVAPPAPFQETNSLTDGAPAASVALHSNEKEMVRPANSTSSPVPSSQPVIAKLLSIFEELSGLETAAIDPQGRFLDLGFDSLFLTQVSQAMQREFHVKITFRQLLDELDSIAALAEYLTPKLPANFFGPVAPETAPVIAAAPSATMIPLPHAFATPSGASTMASPGSAVEHVMMEQVRLEHVMAQQIQAMSQLFAQQIEMLKGTGAPHAIHAPEVPAVAQTKAVVNGTAAPAVVRAPVPQASETNAPETRAEFKPFGPYKPVQKGPTGGLTERQQTYLHDLIARYTRKTAKSKAHVQAHRRTLADPRVAAGFRSQWKEMVYPIVVERSRGTRFWDLDGNEYIDLLNGFGPIVFGHLPEFISQALHRQIEAGIEIGPQTPLAGEVADLICKLTKVERVTFCNTGSEAVMAGLRVARTVTGRQKIALFAGSYHGAFDEVLVKRIGKGEKSGAAPIAPGIPLEKAQNVTVLDYGTPEALAWIREHASELAAVLVEPVQSRHPALQPREFLQELRQITASAGTALILDEVVTGFRVHPGGVQALFNIQADLVTYGKVLGGGMPIGVLAGRAPFMDALDGGMWEFGDDSFPEVGVTFFAGTFVRHPLALAAARAILQHIDQAGPALQEELNERTDTLVARLNGLFQQYGMPSRIENFGSVFYFSIPTDFRFGSLLYYHLREKGIHLQEGFPCFLTTAHSLADIEHICRAFEDSLIAMQAGGVLEKPAVSAEIKAAAVPPPAAEEIPLTQAQLEIWLSAQLSPEASCAFNEAFTVSLRGAWDEQAMLGALQDVVDRHEILRSTFDAEGKTVRFHPNRKIAIERTDLSSSPDPLGEFEKLVAADAHRPFNLVDGPVVRVTLAKLADDLSVILFTSHHIVCDGWSTNVILEELGQLYSARSEKRVPGLAAPLPFSRYAQALETRRHSSEGAIIEQYWLDQFSALPPALDLPTDRPRSSVKSFEGASLRKIIGTSDYEQIKRGGAQNRCTLFVTLLAGFEVLLSRLSGQDDVVVGIPTAGQASEGQAALVGHCVNFLPHRLRLGSDANFGAVLQQAKRTLLDAYEHQDYTYGTLVRKLPITRDPSRMPLIEVQFNLEKVTADLEFKGLRAEVDSCPKSFVNFDLFLNIVESDTGLTLDCDYNSALFDRVTIERWLDHYVTVLQAGLQDANRAVLELPLLTGTERSALLAAGNQTAREYPRHLCTPALIEQAAQASPNAIGVVSHGKSLTYGELNARANQLARLLKKYGAGPGQHVAVCSERSAALLVALLAVMKSGAAYLPLDPGYPKDRLEFILDETKVKVVLTDDDSSLTFQNPEARILRLAEDWPLVARESAEDLPDGPRPEDVAYVIYTSGSTGKPKGVEVTHQALVNFLWSMKTEPGFSASDRLLAVTTVSFDIAGLELYLPLMAGGRVILASDEAARDGYRLASLIEAEKISVLQATPSTWRLLLEAGWKPGPSLKILCGGEALPRQLADELLAGGGEVWNMYGPTETTIWSAVCRVNAGPAPVWVGPPIANTQFYVVDAHNEPTPLGIAGELLIGGDGLARGYFQRPELTKEKFTPDIFSGRSDARLYRTGDLVRQLPNGMLEFLGRLDHQVKIRGFRIELGEIEAALTRIPAISEAVVVMREYSGSKTLFAYYASPAGEQPSAALKEILAREIPSYMIPSFFVRLEAIPRTPNGKIDKRALPVPEFELERTVRVITPPATEAEQILCSICTEVLKLSEIGTEESFFELGADSIHMFQIVARATRSGLAVTAQDILRNPSVAQLAAALKLKQVAADKPKDGPIRRVNRDAFRVASAEESKWKLT